MPRPCKSRRIKDIPNYTCFKPLGIPRQNLNKIELLIDEFESIRLADLEWKSHIESAKIMWISASTFNRILSSARKKTADFLVNWKGMRIYNKWINNNE